MAETLSIKEIEEIVIMLKRMIVDYVEIDGRVFISNHDTETTSFEIIVHFNYLKYECIKFITKYDSILPDNITDKCIKDITTFITNAKKLMLDLYNDNLSNAEIIARALKRGDTSNEF